MNSYQLKKIQWKKNIIYFAAIIFALTLFSCGGGETTTKEDKVVVEEFIEEDIIDEVIEEKKLIVEKEKIVGVWTVEVHKGNKVESKLKTYRTFNADGSYSFGYNVDNSKEGTWELVDNNIITLVDDKTIDFGKIWQINNKEIYNRRNNVEKIWR